MDSSLSLSNSVSKATIYENMELSAAYLADLQNRTDASLSDERIRKGDSILDTYLVLSDEITGGMGSVWRVHHNGWGIDLAMKRPQPRFFAEGGTEKKARFTAECENWINLGLHPNIVSCYYVREIGGVPAIFSEWMDAGSLSDRIMDGSVSLGTEEEIQQRILDIAIQSARGLRYSHEKGLIHQDMKPANLLLTKEWDAKIADFGLAQARSRLGSDSGPEGISGYTPAYCPAEQVEHGEPARWMDVYAWAVTVLEMYAGRRLWQTGAEVKDHFTEYISGCRHRIPEEMQAVLMQCLTEKPDGFSSIENRLTDVYRTTMGEEYGRSAATASDTADLLNNRALSFVDLGIPEQAEACWRQALENNPIHLYSLYNSGLLAWRNGTMDDLDFHERLNRIHSRQISRVKDLDTLIRQADDLKKDLCYRIPGCTWGGGNEAAALGSKGNYLYIPYSDVFNEYRGHAPIDKIETRTGSRLWRAPSAAKFRKSHGAGLYSGLRMMTVSRTGKYLALIGENSVIEVWDAGKPGLVAECRLFRKGELNRLRRQGVNYYDTSAENRSYAEFSENEEELAGRLYGRNFVWTFRTGPVATNDSEKATYCPSVLCQDIAEGRVYSPDGTKYLSRTPEGNTTVFPVELLPLGKLPWQMSVIESFSAARSRETETDRLFRLAEEALAKGDIAGALGYTGQLRGIRDVPESDAFLDLNRRVGAFCKITGVHKILARKDPVYAGPDLRQILSGIRKGRKSAFRVSDDGTWIAVGEPDGAVSVWKTDGGTMAWRKKVHDDEVCCVGISADGSMIATAEYGGDFRTEKICIHDAASGALRESISLMEIYDGCRMQEEGDVFAPNQHITALAFDAEGSRIAVGNTQGSIISIWLNKKGSDRYKLIVPFADRKAHIHINALAFGGNGKQIWSLESDIYDAKGQTVLKLLEDRYHAKQIITTKVDQADDVWSDSWVILTDKQDCVLRLYKNSDSPGAENSYTVQADYIYQ